MTYAVKTLFEFAPVIAFDASTVAVVDTTPTNYAHTLGNLQAILLKRAVYSAFNQSDASVKFTLKQGETIMGELTLASGESGVTQIDVAGVSRVAKLTVITEVTAAGSGTGNAFSRLDVEQPLQVSNC